MSRFFSSLETCESPTYWLIYSTAKDCTMLTRLKVNTCGETRMSNLSEIGPFAPYNSHNSPDELDACIKEPKHLNGSKVRDLVEQDREQI